MLKKDVAVDCWLIPRKHELSAEEIARHGCSLRWMLYRIMVAGFRLCQRLSVPLHHPQIGDVSVGGLTPIRRQWYTGLPVWKLPDGRESTEHPGGYVLQVDDTSGAMFWELNGQPVQADGGGPLYATGRFWGSICRWIPLNRRHRLERCEGKTGR